MIGGALAEVAVAGAALEAVAADDVPFRRDQVADGEQPFRFRLRPHLLDPAGELVADDHRRLEPVAGPGVPFPDVEVGAADTRVVDPDQDVIGAAGGNGHLPQLHADAGGGFDESAHGEPRLG